MKNICFRLPLIIIVLTVLSPFFLHAEEIPAAPVQSQSPEIMEDAPATPVESDAVTENIENAVSAETRDLGYPERIGIALAILVGQALLIWLIWLLFKYFNKRLAAYGEKNIKPLSIKKYRLLNTKQIISILSFLLKILKYIITIFQLFITIPIVFSLFPLTKNLASTLFGYILTPLKNIGLGIIKYIPNLITIIIILLVTRYVMRALKFFTKQITRGKLVIPGFYQDWAQPTFNILRIFLYAFTVAIIYPYLPGAESAVFQGVSIFVGIIVSLGSTSAIGNLIAGAVITYMRPFKIGDRIKMKDVTGFVVEKSPTVIRIRTHKNEYVTFPNMIVLTSDVTNYHTSAEHEEGLLLYTTVTMGYNVPWPQVHEILIGAALKTANTEKKPKPFVLQTALDNYYAEYQINVYTKAVELVPAIYSDLFHNIQDGFREANIDLTTPMYSVVSNAEKMSNTKKGESGVKAPD